MPETPSLPVRLPSEIDDQIAPTLITAHAGVPLVIELFRRVGAAEVINEQARIKQRQRGWPAGGDRCQDLQTLRADGGLATLLGYELPAATTMRDFLETFHMDTPRLWRAGEKAAIPEESGVLGSKKWTPSTYDLGSGGVRWNNYRDSNIRRSSGSKRCGWSWNERVRLTV